jgi:hypothetical protein
VRCKEAEVSGFLIDDDASCSERSFGSLEVGFQRSGCAIWASNVSYGKNDAFGSPVEWN